ncbi:MAG: hypothetical protein ABI444_10785 [Candidatus Kapaibacterium sp.]
MHDLAQLKKHYASTPHSKVLSRNASHLLLNILVTGDLTDKDFEVIKTYTAKTINTNAPLTDKPNARRKLLKIATSDLDRAGDTLDVLGLDLTHFLDNPQFLWKHGLTDVPIHTLGCIRQIIPTENALYAWAEYAEAGASEFIDQVYRLDLDGYLPANSIGFHPIEWEPNAFGGMHFTKWELIECSKVELPMNPFAIDDDGPSDGVTEEMPKEPMTATIHEARVWLSST